MWWRVTVRLDKIKFFLLSALPPVSQKVLWNGHFYYSDLDETLNFLFLHRSCWSPGSYCEASDLYGYHPVEHFLENATHKEAALVWQTFHQIIPEPVEVYILVLLYNFSWIWPISVLEILLTKEHGCWKAFLQSSCHTRIC